MSKLIDSLNKLADELITNHPRVDHGGCCVVAAQMARYLSTIVPTRIVAGIGWCGDPDADLDHIRNVIDDPKSKMDWEMKGVDFHHVLIEFEHNGETYTFDSTDGVKRRDEFWENQRAITPADGEFLVDEARSFADEDSWNPMFSRREVPTVRRRITNFFRKLELSAI